MAWKITKPSQTETKEEEILYNEEVMAMLISYVRMLAEK